MKNQSAEQLNEISLQKRYVLLFVTQTHLFSLLIVPIIKTLQLTNHSFPRWNNNHITEMTIHGYHKTDLVPVWWCPCLIYHSTPFSKWLNVSSHLRNCILQNGQPPPAAAAAVYLFWKMFLILVFTHRNADDNTT